MSVFQSMLSLLTKNIKPHLNSGKKNGFPTTGNLHNECRTEHRDYRQSLRTFLEKIKRLCVASETDEKLFWKLIKGQRSTSQMNAFLVDCNHLTDKNKIREMWADHLESFGTSFDGSNFDNDFYTTVLLRQYTIFLKPALRILRELSASL